MIVTHRTDDMSTLPRVAPAGGSARPKKAAAEAARPRLAMRGAPVPPDTSAAAVVAGVSPSTLAVEAPAVQADEGGAFHALPLVRR